MALPLAGPFFFVNMGSAGVLGERLLHRGCSLSAIEVFLNIFLDLNKKSINVKTCPDNERGAHVKSIWPVSPFLR